MSDKEILKQAYQKIEETQNTFLPNSPKAIKLLDSFLLKAMNTFATQAVANREKEILDAFDKELHKSYNIGPDEDGRWTIEILTEIIKTK